MNRLNELRNKNHKSMKEVADDLGMPYTTYVNYEKLVREPNSDMLVKMAKYFSVSVDYLIGRVAENSLLLTPDITPLPEMKKVPQLGTIACGEPLLAEQNIEDYNLIGANIDCDFSLVCKGDSMINARIFDGDIVYIKKQSDVDDGEIAAVLIDDSATLKKVHKYPNKLVLSPCNPMYNDLVYIDEQLNNIRILGKAVAFTSIIRY